MLPTTSQSFSWDALFTTPLITAFNPGQSPPPVATNTLFILISFLIYFINTSVEIIVFKYFSNLPLYFCL
jgi:hypothetical protein